MPFAQKLLRSALTLTAALCLTAAAPAQTPPSVGTPAPDFTQSTPTGTAVHLSALTAHGTTVLVILRGYPGYQCPYCVKQVHDFVSQAADFAAHHATVLFVYPGPPAALDDHAKEFLAKQADLPANILLVTDPDYAVTNLYHLRWDAPHETAYPATFLLDTHRNITFANISHGHGDRTSATDILAQLP